MKQDYPIRQLLLQRAALTKDPISGILELTPRCNLRCRMCYIRMSPEEMAPRGRERTLAEWLAIAEELRNAGVVFLLLTGGEPLLRPDFPQLYRALAGMGFSISLNTNGTLMNDEIAALFRELPPAAVNLTLYGAGESAYGRLCGDEKAFHRASNAIALLQANGTALRLNTTVTSCNQEELPRIAAFAKARSLPLRVVTYLFPPLRRDGPGMERLPPEEAGALSAESRRWTDDPELLAARIAAVKARVPEPCAPGEDCLGGSREGLRCVAGNCQFWIAWNGEMYPCGMMPEPVVYPFRDGFLAAWRALTGSCAKLPVALDCEACSLKSYCLACAAVARAETGRTDGIPDYACRLTEAYCRTLGNME